VDWIAGTWAARSGFSQTAKRCRSRPLWPFGDRELTRRRCGPVSALATHRLSASWPTAFNLTEAECSESDVRYPAVSRAEAMLGFAAAVDARLPETVSQTVHPAHGPPAARASADEPRREDGFVAEARARTTELTMPMARTGRSAAMTSTSTSRVSWRRRRVDWLRSRGFMWHRPHRPGGRGAPALSYPRPRSLAAAELGSVSFLYGRQAVSGLRRGESRRS
jgi:hypothetical protein